MIHQRVQRLWWEVKLQRPITFELDRQKGGMSHAHGYRSVGRAAGTQTLKGLPGTGCRSEQSLERYMRISPCGRINLRGAIWAKS